MFDRDRFKERIHFRLEVDLRTRKVSFEMVVVVVVVVGGGLKEQKPTLHNGTFFVLTVTSVLSACVSRL